LATIFPPPPMMIAITGRIEERMRANFQLRTYAIINPEQNVPNEFSDNATYYQKRHLRGDFVGDAVLDQVAVVGDAICDFSSSKTVEECNILT
jgi:hypothetical protein